VGSVVGSSEGFGVGAGEGRIDGGVEGSGVGWIEGRGDGMMLGESVGLGEGKEVGATAKVTLAQGQPRTPFKTVGLAHAFPVVLQNAVHAPLPLLLLLAEEVYPFGPKPG